MPDLTPPLQGYALWLKSDPEHQQQMQRIINQYAEKAGTFTFQAHMTLLGLLDKHSNEEDSVLDGAQKVAKTLGEPFQCRLLAIAQDTRYFQCVFGAVRPCQELTRLNNSARYTFQHESEEPFMPHWSFVYGHIDQHQRRSIVTELNQTLQLPLTIPVTELVVMNVQGNPDQWHQVKSFKL